jgi:YVTN family beta-propeller protein
MQRTGRSTQRSLFLFALIAGLGAASGGWADEHERLAVGVQPDGRIVVPTNQILHPAGTQITFPGRPVDLAFSDEGKVLVVKNMKDLVFLDLATGQVRQTLAHAQGFSVVGLWVSGPRVYVSDTHSRIMVAVRNGNGLYKWEKPISLKKPAVGGDTYPAGLVGIAPNEMLVAASRANNVQVVNPGNGKVEYVVPVGVAPYALCRTAPDRCYVSNWGGDPPAAADPQAPSSGTPVRIDPKTGVASQGTVSLLARVAGRWQQLKTIRVGLHPCGMTLSPQGRFLYVANANSDSVSVIDARSDQVVETISCRPEARLPFGSGSNALALSPDGHTLYAANGTNNCVAVIRLGVTAVDTPLPPHDPASSHVVGLIPTAWYPGALQLTPDGKRLLVANIKGPGTLAVRRSPEKGKNSRDHLGSISAIDIPDAARLKQYTQEVNANNRLAYSLAGLEKPRPRVAAAPVPARHGEPSIFKHVIYVIKENRTYDQLFGDIKEGNGDPNLVMFGEEVTPNHHALARQFTLFDNFYCSGVVSADGHQWVNEAYVTDYLEKAFGTFTRSYPDEGQDPLAFAPTGFLWDNARAHGKSFYNYGEFVTSEYPKDATWTHFFNEYKSGTFKLKVEARPALKTLAPFTRLGYPGFPLKAPDVYRARMFLDDLKNYERKGEFPSLLYVYLPCDHTNGTNPGSPTPRAMVADNDLALGQVVQAISKSKFWADTCIFVVEDDPQDGFDHVDGHRSVALVLSPYTRRGFVDHTVYNQTGMVKTIELILGLPAMNQLDLSATPMRACFQAQADLTPYTCLPNRTPLDEMNPPLKSLTGKALEWAKKSVELDLDDADQADADTLNRILWHSTRGYDTPYPKPAPGKKAADKKSKK